MTTSEHYRESLETAAALLGRSLELPLGPGEPPSGAEFRRLATEHTFGDSWPRSGLDVRSKALISVAIAAALGTHEPLRGQLRIALNNGVSKEEVVELFIHLEAYAGAARAFDVTRSRSRCSRRATPPSGPAGPALVSSRPEPMCPSPAAPHRGE
jgi:4-carboxymuconolactone decarboxylase